MKRHQTEDALMFRLSTVPRQGEQLLNYSPTSVPILKFTQTLIYGSLSGLAVRSVANKAADWVVWGSMVASFVGSTREF